MVELKFKDIGERRWLCFAYMNTANLDVFNRWIEENINDRVLVKTIDASDTDLGIIWTLEIRGGDVQDRLLLALRWQMQD